MAVEKERRDFLGMALGGFTAIGGIAALGAAKKTWDPLPSVKAAGFTVVDLTQMQENQVTIEKWRGKPIFILKKGADMKTNERDVVVDGTRYFVAIGLCTHLGCIPAYYPDQHKFICACHGGQFGTSGEVLKAPPQKPLVIPPFKIDGTKLVLGEEGPEYQELKSKNLIA